MGKRALIVKIGAIGDVVMAVPAVRQLERLGYQIDWVCGRSSAPLLACYSWINAIIVDDRRLLNSGKSQALAEIGALWRKVAGRRYDLCATLHYDRRYRLLALPVRAHRKFILHPLRREFMLLPNRHHSDEYARILLGAIPGSDQAQLDSYQPQSLAPEPPSHLPPSPLPRALSQTNTAQTSSKTRIALVPGGARNVLRDDALRRWPVESYAQIAQMLIDLGVQVILTGGANDVWVRPHFSHLPVIDLIDAIDLPQLVALYADVDAVVTHDTGPLHFAGLTATPILAIFGPTDPHTRLPRRPGTVALWGGENFACRPCYDGRTFAPCTFNGCIREVTPEHVLEQLQQLLGHSRAGSLAPPLVRLLP